MNDLKLLQEAYGKICESVDQPFALTLKEKQLFEDITQHAQETFEQYENMMIETIRASVRKPQHIAYPKDMHKSVMTYFRAKLFGRIQNVINNHFPTNNKMVNFMFTICSQPFADLYLAADENDELIMSLYTVDCLLSMKSPEVFNLDKLTRRLPKILQDWLEYKIKQYGPTLDDYNQQRKEELRDERVSNNLSPDFDIDVLKDF